VARQDGGLGPSAAELDAEHRSLLAGLMAAFEGHDVQGLVRELRVS